MANGRSLVPFWVDATRWPPSHGARVLLVATELGPLTGADLQVAANDSTHAIRDTHWRSELQAFRLDVKMKYDRRPQRLEDVVERLTGVACCYRVSSTKAIGLMSARTRASH